MSSEKNLLELNSIVWIKKELRTNYSRESIFDEEVQDWTEKLQKINYKL